MRGTSKVTAVVVAPCAAGASAAAPRARPARGRTRSGVRRTVATFRNRAERVTLRRRVAMSCSGQDNPAMRRTVVIMGTGGGGVLRRFLVAAILLGNVAVVGLASSYA